MATASPSQQAVVGARTKLPELIFHCRIYSTYTAPMPSFMPRPIAKSIEVPSALDAAKIKLVFADQLMQLRYVYATEISCI